MSFFDRIKNVFNPEMSQPGYPVATGAPGPNRGSTSLRRQQQVNPNPDIARQETWQENGWTGIGSFKYRVKWVHNNGLYLYRLLKEEQILPGYERDHCLLDLKAENGVKGGKRITGLNNCWCERVLIGNSGWVNSVAFSPDTRYILSGSDDGTVRLWEVVNGKELHVFEGHTGKVTSVAFSPDGRHILSGGYDNQIILWNAHNGQEIRRNNNNVEISSVAFSPDGGSIIAGGDRDFLLMLDVTSGKERRALKPNFGRTNSTIKSVAFSPDGGYVLSGNSGGFMSIYNVENGSESGIFEWHHS